MEILSPIREQVKRIKELQGAVTLEPIITHIERAEYFYKTGKRENDEHFFTDVIYRTNQAFEGCSRQAYMILAGKTESQAQNIKAYQIEKYFIDKSILSDRVLPQFENYRNNWRNEAAHNFKLFFDESEAYFAILNVSSYAYVLFNQMIEKLAYNLELEKIKQKEIEVKKIKGIMKKKTIPLREKISKLIQEFSKDNELLHHELGIREIEIVATLAAYIQKSSDDIRVTLEKTLSSNKHLRADIFIEYEEEELIVEVKRFLYSSKLELYNEQLIRYLKEAEINQGIMYFTSTSANELIFRKEEFEVEKEGVKYEITMIKT